MRQQTLTALKTLTIIVLPAGILIILFPIGTLSAFESVSSRHDMVPLSIPSANLSGDDSSRIAIFYSLASHDGRIWDYPKAAERRGQLDTSDQGPSALRVGDLRSNRQYRSFLSFDTSIIPERARITAARLRLKQGATQGESPFGKHGSCYVDVINGFFGSSAALSTEDFDARATAKRAGLLTRARSNDGWFEAELKAPGLEAINHQGTTQFRVYFPEQESGDGHFNYVGFFSGEAESSEQPTLIVSYQTP